jgi:hypothetical protein
MTTLRPSVEQKMFFRKKHHVTMQQVPKNKYHCLLADPPEIGISKISEDQKKSVRRLFRQLPSDAKAVNNLHS